MEALPFHDVFASEITWLSSLVSVAATLSAVKLKHLTSLGKDRKLSESNAKQFISFRTLTKDFKALTACVRAFTVVFPATESKTDKKHRHSDIKMDFTGVDGIVQNAEQLIAKCAQKWSDDARGLVKILDNTMPTYWSCWG